jgi:hypothetical protein
MKRRLLFVLIVILVTLAPVLIFESPIHRALAPLIQGLRGQGTVADGIAELEKLPGEG